MPKPAKPPRNRDLARIHIIKAQLKLDDDTYRDILWVHGQVRTSAELDTHGRSQVVKHLEGLAKRMGVDVARKGTPRNLHTKGRGSLLRKIGALLADADLPWAYAAGTARHMYQRERLEWCHAGELQGIVAALHKAAIKRLHADLQAAFGERWGYRVQRVAVLLFNHPPTHDVTRYPEPLSLVLRHYRGGLDGVSCTWPVPEEYSHGACCGGCGNRQQFSRELASSHA